MEIHVRFPPWQFTGTFRVEGPTGAVLDEGVARDAGGLSAGDGIVERVLEGSKGTLTLRLQGGPKTMGLPHVFGRWSVAGGSGAYAAVSGAGTFTSCSTGEPKSGSPYEQQILIGHVRRR